MTTAQEKEDNALKNLAAANAYKRIEPKVLYDLAPTPDLTLDQIQQGLDIFQDPWKETPAREQDACDWCYKPGHEDWECGYLTQCANCLGYGHEEWFCRKPHTMCTETGVCRVAPDHPNIFKGPTCKSHVRPYEA